MQSRHQGCGTIQMLVCAKRAIVRFSLSKRLKIDYARKKRELDVFGRVNVLFILKHVRGLYARIEGST